MASYYTPAATENIDIIGKSKNILAHSRLSYANVFLINLHNNMAGGGGQVSLEEAHTIKTGIHSGKCGLKCELILQFSLS